MMLQASQQIRQYSRIGEELTQLELLLQPYHLVYRVGVEAIHQISVRT